MTQEFKPYTALNEAIRNDAVIDLKGIFEKYPDFITLRVPSFGNWLVYASWQGAKQVVKYLIEIGFDVDKSGDEVNSPPLATASVSGHAEIVKLLLTNGARLDDRTSISNPLFGCASAEIAKLLLDAGMDPSKSYVLGDAVNPPIDSLAYAIMLGRIEVANVIALAMALGDQKIADALIESRKEVILAMPKAVEDTL